MSWLFSAMGRETPPPIDAARLRRIEAKLDLVLNHLGLTCRDDAQSDEVRSLAEAGQKIEAIKVYRERTGASLAEAKRAVEAMMAGRA